MTDGTNAAQSQAEAEQTEQAWRDLCPDSFMMFAQGLTIEAAQGPTCFKNCIQQFQLDAFEDVAPALEAIRDGRAPPRPYNRFWWERTKKSGKDSDLAICVMWLLAYPQRPFYGQIGAANREQAGIVKERIDHLLTCNPWLNELIEVVQLQIRSKTKSVTGKSLAHFDILAADTSGGAHGGTPDILVINELSHVGKWKFVETLMNNADGVPRGIVIIATNAGHSGSEAERWQETAIKNTNWAVRVFREPAPWHSKQSVREAQLRNRGSEYNRLWKGMWTSGTGDALSEYAIGKCFVLDGPQDLPVRGWDYVAGLDLGISRDHSGIMVLAVNSELQKIKTAWFRGFEPQAGIKGGEVDLIAVEDALAGMHGLFGMHWVGYDPAAGGSYMAQRLRRKGVPMHEVSFSSPKNREAMADALVQGVEASILECYDDADGRLRRDFGKFSIKESTFGRSLTAVADTHGHADVGTALAICMPKARDMAGVSNEFLGPTDMIADVFDPERMAAAREDMPDELAEIYDLGERVADSTTVAGIRFDWDD